MNKHKISLTTAILMNINIMVGSGILFGPGIMARISGDASFLGWLMVAFLFLPIVLSTIQLSRMFPGAGGFYTYAKEGLGGMAGYWSGWMYVTGYTFAVAMESLALQKTFICAFHADWVWLIAHPVCFNLIAATVFTGFNFLSLRLFSRILNTITISKLIPLVVLILLIPFVFNPSFTITGAEMSLLPLSLSMPIFGFFGFEYCASMSHHIENSKRNGPLAILVGFLITALLYTLFHFGALNLMGAHGLAEYGAPAFAEFITLPIPFLKAFLGFLIPVATVVALFGTAIGMMNSNAIMLHAMAEEKLFHHSPTLAQTTRLHRPWATILMQGFVVFGIATTVSFATQSLDQAIGIVGNLCNFGTFIAFILPFISLIIVQHRNRNHPHIALTVIGLTAATGLAFYSLYILAPTMIERLVFAMPLIALLALGRLIAKK